MKYTAVVATPVRVPAAAGTPPTLPPPCPPPRMELVGSPDGGEVGEKEGLAVMELVLRALLVKEGEEEGEVEGLGEFEATEADAVKDL